LKTGYLKIKNFLISIKVWGVLYYAAKAREEHGTYAVKSEVAKPKKSNEKKFFRGKPK
jgi:hypothetical protein